MAVLNFIWYCIDCIITLFAVGNGGQSPEDFSVIDGLVGAATMIVLTILLILILWACRIITFRRKDKRKNTIQENSLEGKNMKVEFWKDFAALTIGIPVLGVCSLALVVTGVILAEQTSAGWICSAMGLVFLLATLVLLLCKKDTLSKIVFSSEGIAVKRFDQTLITVRWDEIYEITATLRGKASPYLSFVTKDKKIDIVPTQKVYDTIMILCPSQNLKTQLENNERFEWFRRKKKSKKNEEKESKS